MDSLRLAVLSLAVVLAFPLSSYGLTSVDQTFRPITPMESLTASFATTGVTTVNEYTGLVEIVVSGFGQGSGTFVNDAFYFFESSPGNTITPEPLPPDNPACCSFLRLSFAGSACFPTPPIEDFIVFLDGVGEVPPGTLPAYTGSHAYRFVVDLGASQGRLTLGNMDCGLFDNTGSFTITVNGVVRAPAPSFSEAGAACQRAIGQATGDVLEVVQAQHAKCLNTEAFGTRVCDSKRRDARVNGAIIRAKDLLDRYCDLESYEEIGFAGPHEAIRDGLVQRAIQAAERLIRETYIANYPSSP